MDSTRIGIRFMFRNGEPTFRSGERTFRIGERTFRIAEHRMNPYFCINRIPFYANIIHAIPIHLKALNTP